jgi:hypothetical protein
MTTQRLPALEFPAMLHGTTAAIRRGVLAEGRWWAREYLETGVFPPPRRMRQVAPGEVLVLRQAGELDLNSTRWWIHPFASVFQGLDEGVQARGRAQERQRVEEAFESFCLSTPWGALYHAVSPPPSRSAKRMASRLASVLRFWELLRVPRYAYWFGEKYTLEELMEDLYRESLEAWCPQGPMSVQEHLARAVEGMARATRVDCEEALLRLMPVLVAGDAGFKHRELLGDPGFLRERLAALSPEDFENLSGTEPYTVAEQLAAWEREWGRP